MIDQELRSQLVDALLRVPGMNAPGRDARGPLLAGLTDSAHFQRNDLNARGDVMVLISQLEENLTLQHEWRLLKLIDNALSLVGPTSLRNDLLDLRTRVQQGTPIPIPRKPAEYAKLHRFDLRKTALMCLSIVEGPPRLCGFVIQTQSIRLIENLCETLKYRGDEIGTWQRTSVRIPKVMVVEPRHTPLKTVIEKATLFRELLATKNVVLGIQFAEADDVSAFWEEISTAFAERLDNHLVVLIGAPEGFHNACGAENLPSPAFERQHVVEWVNEIVVTLKWNVALVSDWVQIIEASCSNPLSAGALHIDKLYYELDYFRNRLFECSTEEDFRAVLQEIKEMGDLYAITR